MTNWQCLSPVVKSTYFNSDEGKLFFIYHRTVNQFKIRRRTVIRKQEVGIFSVYPPGIENSSREPNMILSGNKGQ